MVQSHACFVAMSLNHQFQRVSQIPAALFERVTMRDGTGNFLDPTHKPSRTLRSNNGVVSLPHVAHLGQTHPKRSRGTLRIQRIVLL